MLRSVLKGWLGSSQTVESVLAKAGIDPTLRGEALEIGHYCEIARAVEELAIGF
jgi:16S rRNA (adenine1518-N6/adenine1519-N6)-dimethyltransferase